MCHHGGWGIHRAAAWQICESPQCSSYLTAHTKIRGHSMLSSLKAGRCEPRKLMWADVTNQLNQKAGDPRSSSSRTSGFPLPLTHRPGFLFHSGCLDEVYPLRRIYILLSLMIQWIPSPTTLQTHLEIVWMHIWASDDSVKLPWRTNHPALLPPGFQLGCFLGENGLQSAVGFSRRKLSSRVFLHFQMTVCVGSRGSSFWFWL